MPSPRQRVCEANLQSGYNRRNMRLSFTSVRQGRKNNLTDKLKNRVPTNLQVVTRWLRKSINEINNVTTVTTVTTYSES